MNIDALLRDFIRDAVREELRATADAHGHASAVPASSCEGAPMTTAEAARYCGFRTTAAIRKAHLEGRLVPLGRRGGTGTYMWSRQALDAFVAGGRDGIVPPGRPGALPLKNGAHHGKRKPVDHEMAIHNRVAPGEAGRLAQEGGRISDSRPSRRLPDGVLSLTLIHRGFLDRNRGEVAVVSRDTGGAIG
jgi:hypothetical protein